MKNWLTSLFGGIAGVPQIVEGAMSKPVNWALIISGISTVILGLVAKDYNTTGGTVKQ
jgi:hypothetical protein